VGEATAMVKRCNVPALITPNGQDGARSGGLNV
jgi:hypothetical protein